QAARTWRARGPLSLRSISKVTRSPPPRLSKLSELSRPLRWKKYSCPSSAAMKPKPRSNTTFLTLPVILVSPYLPESATDARVRSRRQGRHERRAAPHEGRLHEGTTGAGSAKRGVERASRRRCWQTV